MLLVQVYCCQHLDTCVLMYAVQHVLLMLVLYRCQHVLWVTVQLYLAVAGAGVPANVVLWWGCEVVLF